MGGGGTDTAVQTSQPTNPKVTQTTDMLLGGIQNAYNAGAPAWDKSQYAGVGDATKNAWAMGTASANNPAFTNGVNGAMADFADIAAGKRFGMDDPGYAKLRQGVADDTLTNTNAAFNNSGLFGSDNNQEAAGEGVANALAGLDYANFQNDQTRQSNAVNSLGTLYGEAQLPASQIGAIGSAQDADAQAQRTGEFDQYTRKQNSMTDLIAKLTSAAAGNAASSGTTSTTTTPQAPWWQQLLGAGAVGSGIYKNVWGS